MRNVNVELNNIFNMLCVQLYRLWLSEDNDLVCYCFEYTKKDIEKDYLDNGRSTIFERIIFEKKAGQCNCTQKNPKGR